MHVAMQLQVEALKSFFLTINDKKETLSDIIVSP